jgi:sugar O-acyltransferase (sialic acid O-acetyltransferase NeuD family)
MKTKVVVIGAGAHAAIVIDILELMGKYEIIGVTSDIPERDNKKIQYPFLGTNDILKDLKTQGIYHAAIGIGGYQENNSRKRIFLQLKEMGFKCTSNIHPSAIISRYSTIGEGCTIFPGVIINTGVTIGDDVVIATGTSIDHDTVIHDHALLSAGVNIGGNDIVGEGTLVAIGATVISGITIGSDCLVAAGSTVINNIPNNSIVFGTPARERK